MMLPMWLLCQQQQPWQKGRSSSWWSRRCPMVEVDTCMNKQNAIWMTVVFCFSSSSIYLKIETVKKYSKWKRRYYWTPPYKKQKKKKHLFHSHSCHCDHLMLTSPFRFVQFIPEMIHHFNSSIRYYWSHVSQSNAEQLFCTIGKS